MGHFGSIKDDDFAFLDNPPPAWSTVNPVRDSERLLATRGRVTSHRQDVDPESQCFRVPRWRLVGRGQLALDDAWHATQARCRAWLQAILGRDVGKTHALHLALAPERQSTPPRRIRCYRRSSGLRPCRRGLSTAPEGSATSSARESRCQSRSSSEPWLRGSAATSQDRGTAHRRAGGTRLRNSNPSGAAGGGHGGMSSRRSCRCNRASG